MNILAEMNLALVELLERVEPVVAVVGDSRGGAGAGILLGDGLVLTNHHVANHHVARHVHSLKVILSDDQTFEAHQVASDPEVDLALLQIPAKPYHAAVISTEKPKPGEIVFAYGHPWGQRNVLTGGVLSAVTSARGRKRDVPILRADVQLAPGNSGGPLLNSAGEVIGINAMIFGGDQSVAIPASVILEFLDAAGRKIPVPSQAEAVL